MQRIIPILCIALSACGFVSEGVPTDESSSSSSSDDSYDPTIVTTMTTGVSASATTVDASSSDDGDGSSDESESSSTSDEEASTESTGERSVDYALRFDGTSYARKVDDGNPFLWPSGDFTVEAWINIEDESATGVIFDTANDSFTSGWVLYLHNDYHALVFSVFDETSFNQVVIGPEVAEIGTGWHHIAATKSDASATIHVDGTVVKVQAVSPTMSFDNDAVWSLGGSPDGDPSFNLNDVLIDDVRVTGAALYQQDFEPDVEFDEDDTTILFLRLDEGNGPSASDENAVFDIENPSWGPGNLAD